MATDIKFITPTAQDIKSMLPLWEEQYKLHRNLDDIYYVPWSDALEQKIEAYLEKAIETGEPKITVAVVDEKFVGFVTHTIGEEDYFDTQITQFGSIVEIIVSEKYRGLGIGEKLIAHVEENYFHPNGVKDTRLQCSENNPQAQKFYKRLGFVPRQVLFFKAA